MIEKPKRPKQPSIQERQPPRTLEELVNRYDLDNTKIYDFLDDLVISLNKNQKETDDGLENLLDRVEGMIESGENGNGRYIKYSDGTMICTKRVTGTVNITEQYYGSFYHTPDGQYFDLGNYAQEFIDIPMLNVTFYGANAQWIGAMTDVDKLHIAKLHLLAPTSKTAGAYYNVIAIGKWK